MEIKVANRIRNSTIRGMLPVAPLIDKEKQLVNHVDWRRVGTDQMYEERVWQRKRIKKYRRTRFRKHLLIEFHKTMHVKEQIIINKVHINLEEKRMKQINSKKVNAGNKKQWKFKKPEYRNKNSLIFL